MIIAVKKPDGGYLIGQDTRIELNDVPEDLSLYDNGRLCPSYDDDGTVFGAEGDIPQANFVKYLPGILPKPNTTLTMSHMVCKVVPTLFDRLSEAHLVDESKVPYFDAEFLFARKNKAFMIMFCGAVEELGEEEAFGKGCELADQILIFNKNKDPLVRILECFHYVSKLSYHVSKNVVVVDTKKPEDYILYDAEDIERKLKDK